MVKIGKLKHDVTGKWFGHEQMTIPKGTLVTNQAAEGTIKGAFFINEFSWIPKHNDGTTRHLFIHDATFQGIVVSSDVVTVG